MKGRLVRAALAMMAIALALPAGARAGEPDTYIVELTVAPLAGYDGGAQGIPGTSPQVTGRKLKTDSAPALDYRSYLAGRQDSVLAKLSGPAPAVVYSYRNAFAGFAAGLTAAQAAQLKRAPGVAGVWKSELEHVMDAPGDPRLGSEPPNHLGLATPTTGLWNELGGPLLAGGAGAGVIVADIDTGIEPSHPSFAEDPAKGYLGDPYTTLPAAWRGTCQPDPGFCNHKLIGARFFVDGFGAANVAPDSFLSPRDDDGHGTHTASTAAGNYGVDPVIKDPVNGDNDLGVDLISGIAPRAWVAAYKACWNGLSAAKTGCASADVVKAIDTAVADGADVINMSLGNDTSAAFGAQEASLLNAAVAGVFVANSAGNAGPNGGTVGAPSSVPWTTSVAATTLGRSFSATVTADHAGTPSTFKGASVTDALPATDIADGAQAGLAGANAELCKPGTLDRAAVAGKVVLCLRGDNDRVDKSHNVKLAGGVGMVLYNAPEASDLDADTHWVPTVHLSRADGLALKALADAGATTVAFTQGAVDTSQPAGVLAPFSSRGPQTAVPDIPKPDVAAPGVQILAGAASAPSAVAGDPPGQLFMSDQGTSMAAPQVAGAGALLTQVRATLSPAEIKSQLMLTANPGVKKENGIDRATPFDVGSGEIDPDRAAHSGLVMDTTLDDYAQYLEGIDPTIVGGDIPKKRPSDLNLAAISWSRFAGKDSTTRTFRSIDSAPTAWTVTLQAPAGTTGTVTSGGAAISSFTVQPGAKQALTLSLTRTTAALNAYQFGALVLSDGNRTLRLPISVRPVFAAVTSPVTASTAVSAGAQDVPVKPGFAGPLSALGWGLAAPVNDATGARVTATTRTPVLVGSDPGTQLYPVDVKAGTQLLSGRLANVAAGNDLDLFLYRDPNADGNLSDAQLIGSSRRLDSTEKIDVAFPLAGRYVYAVVALSTPNGAVSFDLNHWLVSDSAPDDPAGGPGLVVTDAPGSTVGDPQTLQAQWSGVTAKGLYLGVITYHATDAPTSANIGAVSIFELTKTIDSTSVGRGPGGAVPAVLSLGLDGPASFGAFKPGVAGDYDATTTARVTSTAGAATLSVSDPGAVAPGRLANGAFALEEPLQVRASSAGGTGRAFQALGAGPLALLDYAGPVSSDALTLAFRQRISASQPLRTGGYGKALTFTLTTNSP